MQVLVPAQAIDVRDVGPSISISWALQEMPPSVVESTTTVVVLAGPVSVPAGGCPTAQQRRDEPQATAVRNPVPGGAGWPTTPTVAAGTAGVAGVALEWVTQPAPATPATTIRSAAAGRPITGSDRL
jgi:hypothetical protein